MWKFRINDFLSALEKKYHLKELHMIVFVNIPKNSKCWFDLSWLKNLSYIFISNASAHNKTPEHGYIIIQEKGFQRVDGKLQSI